MITNCDGRGRVLDYAKVRTMTQKSGNKAMVAPWRAHGIGKTTKSEDVSGTTASVRRP